MTVTKRAAALIAGLAMVATPIAATAANPAAKLSITGAVRAGTPAKAGSKLGASIPGTTLISIGVLAALVVVVLVATGGNDDDSDSN